MTHVSCVCRKNTKSFFCQRTSKFMWPSIFRGIGLKNPSRVCLFFTLCSLPKDKTLSLSLLLARIYTHRWRGRLINARVTLSHQKPVLRLSKSRALYSGASISHSLSLLWLTKSRPSGAALQALPNANKSPNLKPFATRASTAVACNAPSFLFLKQPSAL